MTELARRPAPTAIVFDLDGTLIDSRADIAAAVNHTLSELGFITLPLEQVMGFVGDGARNLIMRAARLPADSPDLTRVLDRFLEYYTAHAVDKTTWMPGALAALAALVEYPLAVCTNKPKAATLAVLSGLNALERFAIVIGGGELATLKPDPLPMRTIAERLACDPASLVIVGDGPQDVEAGRSVGAWTFGVRGGIAAPERLVAANPDWILNSLWELPAAVAQLRGAGRSS